jgi:hypothetical protein
MPATRPAPVGGDRAGATDEIRRAAGAAEFICTEGADCCIVLPVRCSERAAQVSGAD